LKNTVTTVLALFGLLSVVLGVPSQAVASPVSCSRFLGGHCYVLHEGDGTVFYGMSGTWNRANMVPSPVGGGDPNFIDSEMWFNPDCSTGVGWVEEGLFDGYEPKIGLVAYEVFYAWATLPNGFYDYAPIAYISPNANVTDDYQISSPSGGVWNVWWGGNHYTTPATGFNSGTCPDIGGEIATSNACVQTFNMYSHAYNSAGQPVFWNNQYDLFIPSSIAGTQFNGVSTSNSEWSWNTVAGGC
jgi:hypothetical protein